MTVLSDEQAARVIDAVGEAAPLQIVDDTPPLGVVTSLMRERDGWRAEVEGLQRRLKFAESDLDAMRKHQDRDAWYWQGDGYDNLASMTRGMVVVIHAGDLAALIARERHEERAACAAHVDVPWNAAGAAFASAIRHRANLAGGA